MDKIRREAMDDYKQRTDEQKQLAQDFFKAMDTDGDGSISIQEFVAFLRQNGLYSDNFYALFVELDKDKNGTLDYEELITLFYIFNRGKYRDRFTATSSDVNTHKVTKDKSTSKQRRSGGHDFGELVGLFIRICDLAVNIDDAAQQDSCSIM